MTFTIAEHFTCGKDSRGYSEDRIVISENHFGVLDGSRGPEDLGRETISAILDTATEYLTSISATARFEDVASELDSITRVYKDRAGVIDFKRSGGFVFCLYSSHFNEIWRVGDCKFRNGGRVYSNMFKAEEICAAARSLILKSKLNSGLTPEDIMKSDDYHHSIDDLLLHEASFLNAANDPFGIGAVIGDSTPTVFQERAEARPGRLVITTDGYPKVLDTLEETEAELKSLLIKDPLCIDANQQCKGLAPGLVSFDDRSFVSADIQV
jgi:hypothetical protein